MYRIVGWDDLYEVSEKSTAWKPGQRKRSAPLSFVRMKVCGRAHGQGYRIFLKLCAEKKVSAAASFGVFCKLLELAADQDAEFRGAILDRNQQPMDIEEIADLIEFGLFEVVGAFEVLLNSRLGWVSKLENQLENAKKSKIPAEKKVDSKMFSSSAQVVISQEKSESVGSFQEIPNQVNQIKTDQIRSSGQESQGVCIPTSSDYEVYELSEVNILDLQRQFPMVDVLCEVREIRKRLEGNPKLAPRPEKAAKFLLRCLENAKPKSNAEPVKLNDVVVMQEVYRKFPEVGKEGIADFFQESVGEDAESLARALEVLAKVKTWSEFTWVAKGKVKV